MEPILIPTLLFWENKNTWYGSKGNLRFYIRPITVPAFEGEDAPPIPMLEVQLWLGQLTKELSEIIETASFPMCDEGIGETTAWLEEQAAKYNP